MTDLDGSSDVADDPPSAAPDKGAQGRAAVSGVRWLTGAQFFNQGVRTVMNFVLAWFLTTGEFGLMAVAMIVITLIDRLANLGTGQAVIQRENLDRATTDSVFTLNLGIGVALAATIFFAAGPLAILAGGDDAADADALLRVLALSVLVKSLGVVHAGLLRRNFKFKAEALILTTGAVVYLAVAVTLAVLDVGAMSIAIGSTASSVVGATLFFVIGGYRPRLSFDRAALKSVVGFSASLTATNIFNFLTQNVDRSLVSHMLGIEAAGLYQLGVRTLRTPVVTLTTTVNQVLMPTLSRLQDDVAEQRRRFVQASSGTAILAFPAMAGLAIVADPLIDVLLPEEWSEASTVVSLMALVGMLRTLAGLVSPVMVANARTGTQLSMNLMLGGTLIVSYVFTARHSIEAVVIGIGVVHLVLLPVLFRVVFRIIDLPMMEYLRTLAPVTAITSVMAAGTLGVRLLLESQNVGSLAVLVACAAVGAGIYLGAVLKLRPTGYDEMGAILGRKKSRCGDRPKG